MSCDTYQWGPGLISSLAGSVAHMHSFENEALASRYPSFITNVNNEASCGLYSDHGQVRPNEKLATASRVEETEGTNAWEEKNADQEVITFMNWL